jgi:restriction endonuclease S subunit
MKLLKDIAEIRSGFPFRTRPERVATGGCRLVQMRDVNGGMGVISGNLETVEAPANWEYQRLRLCDILFSARGEKNSAAVVCLEMPNAIAASSLYVVRVNEDLVSPHFLVWYLNLPQTKERLRTMQAGSGIPFISIEDFGQLPVRLPSDEIQQQIVDLMLLQQEEQTLMRLIQMKRGELIDGALQTLLNQTK